MPALRQHNTEHRGGPARKSQRKSGEVVSGVPFGGCPLDEAAEIMWRAYPASSADACAKRAARDLGVSRTTILDILAKRTKNPSWTLLRFAIERIPDPWELPAIRRFIQRMMVKGAK